MWDPQCSPSLLQVTAWRGGVPIVTMSLFPDIFFVVFVSFVGIAQYVGLDPLCLWRR